MTTPLTPPADAVARLTKLADDYASRGDFATEDDLRTLLAAYADAARDRDAMPENVYRGNLRYAFARGAMATGAWTLDDALAAAYLVWPDVDDAARTGEAR